MRDNETDIMEATKTRKITNITWCNECVEQIHTLNEGMTRPTRTRART